MFNWLKQLFKPNPYIGMFRGWRIDKYNARSPNGDYSLWIANGFFGFADCHITRGKKALVAGLPRKQRKLVWKALQHDMAKDALKNLEFNRVRDVKP